MSEAKQRANLFFRQAGPRGSGLGQQGRAHLAHRRDAALIARACRQAARSEPLRSRWAAGTVQISVTRRTFVCEGAWTDDNIQRSHSKAGFRDPFGRPGRTALAVERVNRYRNVLTHNMNLKCGPKHSLRS